jgi:hypothetical protein
LWHVVAQRDSITAGIAKGDSAALEALRDRLAREMDETDSQRLLAVLGRQFVAVVAALSKMKAPPTTHVDQIVKRRAARRAAVGQSKKPG